MEQFSLEEYLTNPSKKVVTREGKPAKILYTDARGEYPVIALVEHYQETFDIAFSFTKDGKWCTDGTNSNKDLFFAPEKHEGWINLYQGPLGVVYAGSVHHSKDEAEEHKDNRECFVTTIKIEWEE